MSRVISRGLKFKCRGSGIKKKSRVFSKFRKKQNLNLFLFITHENKFSVSCCHSKTSFITNRTQHTVIKTRSYTSVYNKKC